MRPSRMVDLLAVPGTNEQLKLVVSEYAGDEPYSGWLEDDHGTVWARLERFRFHFVKFADVSTGERQELARCGPKGAQIRPSVHTTALDERISWSAETIELEGYLKGYNGYEPDASFSIESTAACIELLFLAHGWSGIVAVDVDGTDETRLNLFNRENSIVLRHRIENPERRLLKIRGRPAGNDPEAQGCQVLLEGIIEYVDGLVVPSYTKIAARNRGGHFRPRFFEIAQSLGEDAVILDIGGGRRQLDDHRYINLEYSTFEEPDIFGDATALPFRDGSIDFVYSAAVLEHVRDPLAMGREINRVLKKGSRVLANSAFMQPVHSEGQHFFNLTPYGIDLTFNMFEERTVWWETDFGSTIRWLVDVAQLRGKLDDAKIETFLAISEEMSRLITPERGMYCASGVWLEGVK